MGPQHKKSKTNHEPSTIDASSSSNSKPVDAVDATSSNGRVVAPRNTSQETPVASQSPPKPDGAAFTKDKADKKPTRDNKSWYGGSWRSKASPIAQVAKESVSVAKGATSELLAEGSKKARSPIPAHYMSQSLRRSSKSVPLAASETRVNVSSSGSSRAEASLHNKSLDGVNSTKEAEPDPPLPPDPTDGIPVPASATTGESKEDTSKSVEENTNSAPAAGAGWFGWWSRPDGYHNNSDISTDAKRALAASAEEAQRTPLPGTPVEQSSTNAKDTVGKPDNTAELTKNASSRGLEVPGQREPNATDKSIETVSTRSWFGLWSNAQNVQRNPPEATKQTAKGRNAMTNEVPHELSQAEMPTEDAQNSETVAEIPKSTVDETTAKPTGWAFWSKEKPKDGTSTPRGTQKQVGELAVADTPSQTNPEAAQFNEQREASIPKKDPPKPQMQRGRAPKPPTLSSTKSSPSHSPSRQTQQPQVKAAESATTKQSQKTSPNLLLPSFRDTYQVEQPLSFRERLIQYFIPPSTSTPPHVNILPNPPRINKALAIGVHGYFPAPLIQKVLGQPTGTSIRFANFAASAVKSWAEAHQPGQECDIEKISLEGEGFIEQRVDMLWKLLLNWIEHLRSADLILVACHSQGVPVAIMLVARLVMMGCVNSGTKIGVCAMAGVNLGPFPEYKSRFFGGSAAELFEFSRPDSTVSKKYEGALSVALDYGVRIVYVGSIDDQLVSLESSTFSTISHPYIYRAVFVDGRAHAPDFMAHLVGFALKLRNLAVSDHGLIRELSAPLAGSLYSGAGHSTIYDDAAVYELAVEFALETT
ncbi:hypothetical protein LTR04_002951, partial [Oleoguttula sp. CCFEE 6159]